MTSLAVNDNNDIFIGSDGNLAIVTDLDAVLEDCEHYAKAQLGEMFLQTTQGVPYDDTVFSRRNLIQFRGRLARQLLRVPNVLDVPSLNVEQNGDVLEYQATIRTIYGEGLIDGQL